MDFLMVVPPDYQEIPLTTMEISHMPEILQHVSNSDWLSLTLALQEYGTIPETETVIGARVFSVESDYRMWLLRPVA